MKDQRVGMGVVGAGAIGLRGALEAGRVPQEVLDCHRAMLNDTNTMRNELRAYPPVMGPVRGMDERVLLPASLLAKIRTPVSFLWGEEDPFGDANIARRFVAQLPDAELELLPGTGHAVWIDDPDHAATTTRTFLAPSGPAGSGN